MKKFVGFIIVFGCIAAFASVAGAANTSNQTVTYAVSAINEFSVSASLGAMTVSGATAGSEPTEVSNALTTYSITTNGTKKITAVLDTNMPTGVTLTVTLAAPTGATSAGDMTLSPVAAEVVTGITKKAESGKSITYKLSATVAAGVVSSDTRTVTFTIVNP